MNVEVLKLGTLQANCYILELNGDVLVIDPGDDFYILKRHLMDKKIVGVLITHGHSDHIGALKSVVETYKVPVYKYDNLNEGKISIGNFNIEVIYTPGHSNDSVSFYFYEYNLMFVGDFVFKGTVGRMDMPTGSISSMKQSLKKIYDYNERIKLYPGHGEATYLKDEKRENQYFIQWVANQQ